MEPKPVHYSLRPTYPTRREMLAGTAAFALASLAGSGFAFAETEDGTTVAPIFEHGEGRGAIGCIVLSPPVFLSEEEGMQILREEFAKHGVTLKAGGLLEGVRVPGRIIKPETVDKGNGETEIKDSNIEDGERSSPLKLDGIDSNGKIAVEFLSIKDYFALGGPVSSSTCQSFDFKETAEYVAAKVKEQGKRRVALGMFYDPVNKLPPAEPPKNREKIDQNTAFKRRWVQGTAESKKQLRQQAQDYIAWLKDRKVIVVGDFRPRR